ncbi:MAG TPA: hypothetical protein VFG68_21600 [Fimbriiglobus sp.]|nr:hypothetical protein [Fimbriiglobus sp.]
MRQPTPAQLGQMMHGMFVDIRNLSYHPGDEKLINRIADIAELVPLQLINPNPEYMAIIVAGVRELCEQYPMASRYLDALETDDAELKERLCPTHGVDWATGALPPESWPNRPR